VKICGKNGLSLIEIVIAIGIAMVMVVSLLLFFSYVFASVRSGKNKAKAASIAQKYLERLKADQDYLQDVIKSPQNFAEKEVLYNPNQEAPTVFTVAISATPMPPDNELVDILIQVNWKEHRSGVAAPGDTTSGTMVDKSTTMETYLNAP